MKLTLTKAFFALTAFEGLLALAGFFLLPSEPSSAFLFGLSKLRLALVLGTVLLFFPCLGITLNVWRSDTWLERIHQFCDRWLLEGRDLVPVTLGMMFLGLIGLTVTILTLRITPTDYEVIFQIYQGKLQLLHTMAIRVLPLLLWGTAVVWQSTLWLILRYGGAYRDRPYWRPGPVFGTLLGLIAAVATIAHWIILAFRFRVFLRIPGWYWDITNKPLSMRDGLFLMLLAGLLVAAWWIFHHPRSAARNLALIFCLGYAVQLGMGIVEGQGVESLRLKVFTRAHRAYAEFASSSDHGVVEAIRNYETLYGHTMFPSTKPPGVMAVYIGLERVLNGIDPQPNAEARFVRLSTFIAWTFPFVSLLMVFFLYGYVRRLALADQDSSAGYLAPLVYIVTPNIVLFTLFLDQAVYPALFLAATLLIIWTFRRQSLLAALATGAFLYAAAFFTFSMLPLFGFLVVYAALDWWLRRNERSPVQHLKLLASAGLGALVLFLALRFFLNYDILLRYRTAMSVVYNFDHYLRVGQSVAQTAPSLTARLSQIGEAAFLNNVEFATAVGLPAFALFLARSANVAWAFIRRRARQADAVQAAFLATFVAMNLIGQMRGEAARLWMFWVPMAVIFAALELAPLIRRRQALAYLLLAAQFITLVLTYKFQDFIM